MIYTENTSEALKIAYMAHNGQVDKGGLPYIYHPTTIAEQMDDEDSTIVALLHDVIEDTPYNMEYLRQFGFAERVYKALELLTHKDGVPYMEYIEGIKGNYLATKVKIADLRHNSNVDRLLGRELTQADKERLCKYKKALEYLQSGSEV